MRGLRSSSGLLVASLALAQAPPKPGLVEGTVTHSLTGAPILRAHVALRGVGPQAKSYGALTNTEGKFSIAGVFPGTYRAAAERVGFFAPAEAGGRTTIEVALGAGEKKDDLKFRLAPLGSISGRVVDAEGEPVEAALVTIDTRQISSASPHESTDDQGRFRLGGLLPGRYRVKAAPASVLPTPPEIRTDGTVEVRYAPTYYGGVMEYKAAARIEVGTGHDVTGIEIPLRGIPMVRISGRVIGVSPEARAVGLMFSQTTGTSSRLGVKNDGTFEVWNVDPGKYFLTAVWGSGNQRVQTAPVNVEIGQSNLEHIELRVVPPSPLTGQVVFEDEPARPQASKSGQGGRSGETGEPKLELRTVDPGMFANPVRADVAADGSFHLAGVAAARYRVMLSWTSGYVKAITLGQHAAEGNVLDLRNGAAGAALTVLVSAAFGTVSGTVADDSGPVAGARVALVRDDFVSLGDVTFASTDAAGSYTIDHVRPGKYRIAAIEDNDTAARWGNLDDYEDIVARIEVQPKDKVTQELRRHRPVR